MGFQSDSMDAPAVELSLLGTSIVVLQDPGGLPHAASEIERLGKLIDRLHACQSRALVRHVASWEDVRRLAGLGVDLIAMAEDERDAG